MCSLGERIKYLTRKVPKFPSFVSRDFRWSLYGIIIRVNGYTAKIYLGYSLLCRWALRLPQKHWRFFLWWKWKVKQSGPSLRSGGSIFTVHSVWCYSRLAAEVTSPLNLKRSVAYFAANPVSAIELTLAIAFNIWNAKISLLPNRVTTVL